MNRIAFVTALTGCLLLLIAPTTHAQETKETHLSESLNLLGDKLERYGEVRISYGIQFPGRQTRQRFEFLKSQGCLFRYRLLSDELSSTDNNAISSGNPIPLKTTDWSVNLADVDPESVEIKTDKRWTGGFVNFRIADGSLGVKCHNCYGPNPNVYSTGGFAIGNDKALTMIADELKTAIGFCRK